MLSIFHTPCRFLLGTLLLFSLVFSAHTAPASDMPGMGSASSEDADKGNVPADVEAALDTLLGDIAPGASNPSNSTLAALINFVLSDVNPSRVRPQKRPQGSGAFVRASLNVPLKQVLRYYYDPEIPGEAIYPNVLRRSYWLPESDIVTRKVQLWDMLGTLKNDSPPVVLRGAEFEEITPDTFSGCYYNYILDRLLILLRHQGRAVLVSATKQRAPSSVGRVGAIVGKDNDWNYVYSKVVGSNLKLASWAETYMYDSANITVFYETTPNAATTEMAFFKYVRAGWANMNMVKPSHITSGSKRYLEGMRQVLESTRLPKAEAIASETRKFRGMDETGLRQALLPYNDGLAALAGKGTLSSSDFKKLLGAPGYINQLTQPEMSSELIKQYMKDQLGKPQLNGAPSPR